MEHTFSHTFTFTHIQEATHSGSRSRFSEDVFYYLCGMLLLPAEQKAANGRAGFELANVNWPLLVIGLFVASKAHPNPQRSETAKYHSSFKMLCE